MNETTGDEFDVLSAVTALLSRLFWISPVLDSYSMELA